jgi:hypothetical protein
LFVGGVRPIGGWLFDQKEYSYSGLGAYCPEHIPLSESYEGLPDEDQFEDQETPYVLVGLYDNVGSEIEPEHPDFDLVLNNLNSIFKRADFEFLPSGGGEASAFQWVFVDNPEEAWYAYQQLRDMINMDGDNWSIEIGGKTFFTGDFGTNVDNFVNNDGEEVFQVPMESYEGLPDQDEFMDEEPDWLPCTGCGEACENRCRECFTPLCSHCEFGIDDHDDDFDMICKDCVRGIVVGESYDGLPDEDEFMDEYLSCDGCGRDTDMAPHDSFIICTGGAEPGQPSTCGYIWCEKCAGYGIGWAANQTGDLISCPACSPEGIDYWKVMNPGRLDESYEGLPDEDEFSENPLLDFLNQNRVIMTDDPREPTKRRLVTSDGREVTSLVVASEDFRMFHGHFIVSMDWSKLSSIHPGEWAIV